MKPPKRSTLFLLTAYCAPWFFLSLYGDRAGFSGALYLLPFIITALLAWVCRRTNRIPLAVAGNLLPTLLSVP